MPRINTQQLALNISGRTVLLDLLADRLANGHLSLDLIHSATGRIFTRLTVDMPDQARGRYELFAKHWSGYEPWFRALQSSGTFTVTGRRVPCLGGDLHVWRLTDEAIDRLDCGPQAVESESDGIEGSSPPAVD